ncbi:MAG: hypothetical protein WCL11_21990, partial [Verrucomicrobiota bacterium]
RHLHPRSGQAVLPAEAVMLVSGVDLTAKSAARRSRNQGDTQFLTQRREERRETQRRRTLCVKSSQPAIESADSSAENRERDRSGLLQSLSLDSNGFERAFLVVFLRALRNAMPVSNIAIVVHFKVGTSFAKTGDKRENTNANNERYTYRGVAGISVHR